MMLRDYKDKHVCDLLLYGFPIGFTGDENTLERPKEIWKHKNYKGAEEFPVDINNYIEKESQMGSLIGPFKSNPFSNSLILSPLNTVPKKDVSERRIILDLSHPKGLSVNDFIPKDIYLGENMPVIYPRVDDLVQMIKEKGRGCLLFKKDLRKAFRQISICPSSYNVVAFTWQKHIFCDTVLSMGMRSSSQICQRVTNAVSFIMFQLGVQILNYLDDLAGAENRDRAHFAYSCLGAVLQKCGFRESVDKAVPPSEIMVFLGVLFNTITMTLEVTPERVREILDLVQIWLLKSSAKLKEIQSLLGKLHFVAACVKPSRIFVSRMLIWLRSVYKSTLQEHKIPLMVKKDLQWWSKFLPVYNGISMMQVEEWSKPDEIFSCDSCLEACGGFWMGHFYHARFPSSFSNSKFHITALEMIALIICLKLWGRYFRGKRIIVFSDSNSACLVVNNGKAKCPVLQECLREICYIAAIYEFEIRLQHLDSQSNRIADHLSRFHLGEWHRQKFLELTEEFDLTEELVDDSFFHFVNTW